MGFSCSLAQVTTATIATNAPTASVAVMRAYRPSPFTAPCLTLKSMGTYRQVGRASCMASADCRPPLTRARPPLRSPAVPPCPPPLFLSPNVPFPLFTTAASCPRTLFSPSPPAHLLSRSQAYCVRLPLGRSAVNLLFPSHPLLHVFSSPTCCPGRWTPGPPCRRCAPSARPAGPAAPPPESRNGASVVSVNTQPRADGTRPVRPAVHLDIT